jgi:hypothetical protein
MYQCNKSRLFCTSIFIEFYPKYGILLSLNTIYLGYYLEICKWLKCSVQYKAFIDFHYRI